MQPIGGNHRGGLPVGEHPPHHKASISEIALLAVRRTVLGDSVDAKQAEAIRDLVISGSLQKVAGPTGKKGGRPSVRWLVNPKATPPSETTQTAAVKLVGLSLDLPPSIVGLEADRLDPRGRLYRSLGNAKTGTPPPWQSSEVSAVRCRTP
jgi:hypothetical protein